MDTGNAAGPCIAATKVEGATVYNLQGDKLGAVDDLVIDKVSGQARYAALAFGGFLGMGTDHQGARRLTVVQDPAPARDVGAQWMRFMSG